MSDTNYLVCCGDPCGHFSGLQPFIQEKVVFCYPPVFHSLAMGDAYHRFNRHLGKTTLIVSETSQTVSGENVPFQASLS
ncbi:MAG TPA: hypothetical protein VMD27_09820 [Candidatus Aquilonibacter sp.]|nr:hypothetical protein [Candidatus Aquilonibacter sp.]